MHRMKIFKGRDLKELSLQDMMKHFGKAGNYFYNVVRGIDEREVVSHRVRKSIGAERTFESDLTDLLEVRDKLREITDIMWKRCESRQKTGKTLTLKLRFADFSTISRSSTSKIAYTRNDLDSIVMDLLPTGDIQARGVRLLGITLSNFQEKKQNYPLQLKIDW